MRNIPTDAGVNYDLSFGTIKTSDSNAVERLRIKADGDVLIGGHTQGTNDISKLSVFDSASNLGIIQIHMGAGSETDGDLSGIAFGHGGNNTSARPKVAIASRAIGSYGKGDLCFYVDNANDNNVVTDADEKVRIARDGLITVKGFNGTGIRLEGSGSDYQGVQLKVTDASASQTRNVFIDAVNEDGNAVANQIGAIQADGGSMWSWSTQEPANNRNDRRAERVRITANGTVEFYGGTGSTPQIKVQSEGGGVGLFFANYQGISDTGDTTRLGVGLNDNALIFMNASGDQVQNFAIGTTDQVPLVFSTSNTPRVKIQSTGKFTLNNGASEYASGTIQNVNQNDWYEATPTIQWSTYAVVGAIIMVCYEDNNADGHNLGAYFVGPATSAYAGMTTTPFHRLHGSTDIEVKIDQVGGTGNRKLHFRCTHSSANGNANKFLRWTIIRAHSS